MCIVREGKEVVVKPIYAADQGLKGAKVMCMYKQRLNAKERRRQ